ncbi:DUF4394 domain-containing protein [Candidatus Gracilibacteria bacterium]|nr:DUF4394 domain-containing protein [Candidatus Gracilibacteria bacterium]
MSCTAQPTWTLNLHRLIAATLLLAMVLFAAHPTSAQPAAAASGGLVYASTISNRLISFDRDQPATILSNIAISNLAANDSLVGIDIRPATDRLYGLGKSGQLYAIDTISGFARPIGIR